MKIAQLVPVEETVPPRKYGGTELVASNLTEELVKRGHDVTLFASGGSKTSATLLPIFDQPVRELAPNPEDAKLRETYKYMAVGKAINEIVRGDFDIIHNHIGWRVLPFAPLVNAPIVTTLHGPLSDGYMKMVYSTFKKSPYVTISNAQRKPMDDLNYAGTVYNGIEVDKFTYNDKPADYVAFLGRMSPEKGPKEAIMAAKAAGIKLIMAAKVDAVDQKYFDSEIKPLIDDQQIKFIGEVDHPGKVKLLKDAIALFALIQWEEPFGLFMTEAMACGTPVIATRRGSVPELVQDGVNGFIVENTPEAVVAALKNISKIKRSDCRKIAEDKFSVGAMVTGYEEVYRKLVSNSPKKDTPPKKSWLNFRWQ
ncbi:MAG: glycosyltransferase family 4 protein [Patescibacteria group bacterium]